MREERKRDLFVAWHVAAYTRGKKLPRLDQTLRRLDKGKARVRRRKMTPEEMQKQMERWERYTAPPKAREPKR